MPDYELDGHHRRGSERIVPLKSSLRTSTIGSRNSLASEDLHLSSSANDNSFHSSFNGSHYDGSESGTERHVSIASTDEYCDRPRVRGRSVSLKGPEHFESNCLDKTRSSSRGRSRSTARSKSRTRSKSRVASSSRTENPQTQEIVELPMERGRKALMPADISTDPRSRSESRARSKSRTRSKSRRRAEKPADDYFERSLEREEENVYREYMSRLVQKDSRGNDSRPSIDARGRSSSRTRISSSTRDLSVSRKYDGREDVSGNDSVPSRTYTQEEDDDSAELEPQKQVSFFTDCEESRMSGSHQRGRSAANQGPRSRSLSKSRSSFRGNLPSQERVSFAIETEVYIESKDNTSSTVFTNYEEKYEFERQDSPTHHNHGRGRSSRDVKGHSHEHSSSRKSRSLSTNRRPVSKYVDFDPSDDKPVQRKSHSKSDFSSMLRKPKLPNEKSIAQKNSVVSYETEETLTIDDDDDSFAAHDSMMEDPNFGGMADVAEESGDEGSVLSEGHMEVHRHPHSHHYLDPMDSQRQSSMKPRLVLSRKKVTDDSEKKHDKPSKVKSMLHMGKRRTAPSPHSEKHYPTESEERPEFNRPHIQEGQAPSLLVESAGLSLMLLQKHNHDHESSKRKSRLTKFLHR